MGSDVLSSAGLQVKSAADIVAELVTALQGIYGAGINTSQNTPDGQLINIFAQSAADMREVLMDIYNSFSVQTAYGVLLDQRVALNGLSRRQGTFTQTPVSITVGQALTLYGLDQTVQPVFTVSDNAGNQYQLLTTHAIGGAGTSVFTFQAANVGAVLTLQNTITNQVTVVLGVTAVNNPSVASQTGVDEETDAQLKVRHAQSFFLAAYGPVDAVQAALLAIAGVPDALVQENTTGATVNGIPANSIWCIADDGGGVVPAVVASIGQAIYAKKMPGCGMKGSQSVTVTRPNGNTFIAKYDRPINQNLYIKFTILPKSVGLTFDHAMIATELVAALVYKLNQQASIGDVISAMLVIAPTAILTVNSVSGDNSSFGDTATPTDPQHRFVVLAANITIAGA